MLDFTLNRRAVLKVGALAVGGLTLPGLLKARAASGSASSRKSVILVWAAGGPSHIDMYDLKPNAPAEVRGEFKPIPTNVTGVQIGEHLPQQAKMFDKLRWCGQRVPHERRARHGFAVDADRLPGHHRGERQHLPVDRVGGGEAEGRRTNRACPLT